MKMPLHKPARGRNVDLTPMKKFILGIALALTLASFPAHAEKWETDYPKAIKAADTEKKLVLMDFTGSDWCIWCKKLDQEVFSKPEFKDYAKKNLVLMKLDFPRGFQLPVSVKKQNDELAKQYQVKGFPTIVVLNGAGKQVGQLGYMEGGPAKFIEALKALPQS